MEAARGHRGQNDHRSPALLGARLPIKLVQTREPRPLLRNFRVRHPARQEPKALAPGSEPQPEPEN